VVGKLARLFRDELHCKDALYLDGAVSSLWAPSLGRSDSGNPLGPLASSRPVDGLELLAPELRC
jgi:uncharacterized protein YigE (DUF2233 family)